MRPVRADAVLRFEGAHGACGKGCQIQAQLRPAMSKEEGGAKCGAGGATETGVAPAQRSPATKCAQCVVRLRTPL
jgi:hypothetical protein